MWVGHSCPTPLTLPVWVGHTCPRLLLLILDQSPNEARPRRHRPHRRHPQPPRSTSSHLRRSPARSPRPALQLLARHHRSRMAPPPRLAPRSPTPHPPPHPHPRPPPPT